MTPISRTVAAWRKLPARARRDLLADMKWGAVAAANGIAASHPYKHEFAEDAKASRAAIALLRAAAKPRKARSK